jgi:hypothetical protein
VAWDALANQTKDAFVARLTRGVVWGSVLQALTSENLSYLSYEVRQFVPSTRPVLAGPPAIDAELDDPVAPVDAIRAEAYGELGVAPPPQRFPPRPSIQIPGSVFVDARGFDRWWFVDSLIHPRLRGHFSQANRNSIEEEITDCLAVAGGFPEGLHVPMLASRRGPGAPNLMALGWMADQILRCYVTPSQPRPVVPP